MSYPAELTHAVDSRLIVLKKVHKTSYQGRFRPDESTWFRKGQ